MRSLSSICLAGLVALVVLISGTVASAQAPSPKTPAIEAPADPKTRAQAAQPIPLEEVPGRAESTRTELDTLLPTEASRQKLERISSELDHALPEVKLRLAKTREALAARPNVRTLQELAAELSEMRERLRPLHKELDRQINGIHAALQRLDTIAMAWEAAGERARREGATGTTVIRITTVRGDIDKSRSTVVKRRDQILAVRDRLVDPSGALVVSLEEVQSATDARLRGIFRADQPPLWSPQVRESLREEWKVRGPQHFLQRLQEGGQYAREHGRLLGFQLALFVALGLGLCSLRGRARAWAEDDYNLRDAKEVFERPWAVALLIAVLLSGGIHPLAPHGAGLVTAALSAVAILRISRHFVAPVLAPLPWGIVVLYVVDRARDLTETMPTLERVVFLVEVVGALGLLLWLLRPSRLPEVPLEYRQIPFFRLIGVAMRIAVAVLALAIVAELAGFGNLANLLGNGALRSAFLGLFVFVSLIVVNSLATFALVVWPLRLLRAISRHRLLVRRRLERVLSVLAVGVWATFILGQLDLLNTTVASVGRMLAASVSVGAFSVSAGAVMAFAVTVWLSFLLARIANFVLQEDVFTRVHTGRGVPYAISGLVRYTVIFLGLLVALSAAGIDLTKLTIIAGGLGVGIGFGLQNVVNNFVSGLILLFERPIQVGDTVQLPNAWGDIKRIGIRASVIRTFDGAEVIVPNGKLISDELTNWTLSDRRRRIEVDVGVEYGTPAQRVIDLLVGVAKANPRVIPDPEPRAFFLNFGDSALEFKLRAWVENFDDGYSARSDLAVAIQEALDHAGIGVPFPQRDVHIIEASGQADPAEAPPEKSAAPPSGKTLPIRSDRRADDSGKVQDRGD